MVCWKIEFEPEARKELQKLDKYSQRLIQSYLNDRILKLEHPKQFGKPLLKNLKGLWRYRMDKFRIICNIEESKLIILTPTVFKKGAE